MRQHTRWHAVLLMAACAGLAMCAQDIQARTFAFQEVLLNMHIAQVPLRYKSDCGSGGDARFFFCTSSTAAGVVPVIVELSFRDERVVEIQAYFPSEHYQIIWLALREKWGKEDRRSGDRVEWFSTPMAPGQPIPDELTLLAKPASAPRPDGRYYLPTIEYSVIDYQSLAAAREDMRRRQELRERTVKGVAGKL